MIDYYKNRMNLVLPGAGYLGCYYFGAIGVLMQVWPEHPFEKISGASCGGIIAATLGSGLSLPKVVSHYNKVLSCKDSSLTEVVRKNLEEMLPIRAHKIVSGNIGISVTKWKDFTSILATHFDSRSELIDAVVAGCFIPLWSGKLMPPSYLGTKCLDGAWSDNVPTLDIDECDQAKGVSQIIICPFNGDVDVCPDDDDQGFGLMHSFGIRFYFNLNNFYRSLSAIFPRKPETVDDIITQGHNDMKRYLLNDANDLLKCRQCFESFTTNDNNFTSVNLTNISKQQIAISACLRCLLLKEKVSNLKVPHEILSRSEYDYNREKLEDNFNSIYNSPLIG